MFRIEIAKETYIALVQNCPTVRTDANQEIDARIYSAENFRKKNRKIIYKTI